MYIHRIYVSKSGSTKVYHGYLELIGKRLDYWQQLHGVMYVRFKIHLDHVRQQEKALERLYNFEKGDLKGAHFVMGSGREMREKFANPRFREALKNGDLRFVIYLEAETRQVKVFTKDDQGELYTFNEYKLSHNFFGGAIMDDPITSVG